MRNKKKDKYKRKSNKSGAAPAFVGVDRVCTKGTQDLWILEKSGLLVQKVLFRTGAWHYWVKGWNWSCEALKLIVLW